MEKEILNAEEISKDLDRFDQPIPILGFQTPQEAVKTKEGRKEVEALLLRYERRNDSGRNTVRMDVAYLRKGLGLRKC